MPKFRKKPVVIEAHQMPPEGEYCTDEMLAFLCGSDRDMDNSGNGGIFIYTLEGRMEARPGDWIIRGVNGEYYPCKPDIFEQTYELVD